jgi:peptidoglycan/xylan/chitin deacetylase (PgdA/CDA1 family)
VKIARKLRSVARFLGSRFTGNSAIPLYHRVAKPDRDPFKLCVTPDRFAGQMEALRSLGTPLSISDFTRQHREGTLKPKSLCVTFDDGYIDFVENALPILEKFELPAVVYCVSGNLGRPFWWDRLLASIHGPGELPPEITLNSGDTESIFDTAGLSRDEVFDRIYAHLRDLGPGVRDAQLDGLEKAVGPTSDPRSRLMTADEIRSLSQHPLITIGAHTVSHSPLTALSSENQFTEIDSSIRDLSEIIGEPVTSFSYPFGQRHRDYDAETLAVARKAGLKHALAADLGVVTAGSDPFCLPRIWIHDFEASRFERRLRLWL